VAIFVSNLPESIGSATEMHDAGRPADTIRRLWLAVAVVCALATLVGYAVADAVGGSVKGAINGFAAGALLVMLVDSMIPTAAAKARRPAGLATALGFAAAAGLSQVS
jgi:zinc transporter, ZIP family